MSQQATIGSLSTLSFKIQPELPPLQTSLMHGLFPFHIWPRTTFVLMTRTTLIQLEFSVDATSHLKPPNYHVLTLILQLKYANNASQDILWSTTSASNRNAQQENTKNTDNASITQSDVKSTTIWLDVLNVKKLMLWRTVSVPELPWSALPDSSTMKNSTFALQSAINAKITAPMEIVLPAKSQAKKLLPENVSQLFKIVPLPNTFLMEFASTLTQLVQFSKK